MIDTTVFPLHRGPGSALGFLAWECPTTSTSRVQASVKQIGDQILQTSSVEPFREIVRVNKKTKNEYTERTANTLEILISFAAKLSIVKQTISCSSADLTRMTLSDQARLNRRCSPVSDYAPGTNFSAAFLCNRLRR
jgi:hypothetical protein